MNQKIWSGLTATLLIATLGVAPTYANPPGSATEGSTGNSVSESELPPNQGSSTSTSTVSSQAATSEPSTQSQTAADPQTEVVKVGEYQSQENPPSEETITTIYPHQLQGRQAATLYVRNIPVLTFLGESVSAEAHPDASTPEPSAGPQAAASHSDVKVASTQEPTALKPSASNRTVNANQPTAANETKISTAATANPEASSSDPVWRATRIAAHLNQLHQNNVDANTITVTWDNKRQTYVIKAAREDLVAIDSNTVLPNSTRDVAQDALQATNLLRRQLGSAPPLQSIPNPNAGAVQFSLGPFRVVANGMASWYGPGLDGNYSANGEVFNQYELTAAHPSLPFGTQVRVTNLDNGSSVIVRITDRGPHIAGRIIDLSTAAAQVIGLVQSGVAPVKLEVMDRRQASVGSSAN